METQPPQPVPRSVLAYVAFLALISLNTTVLGYFAPHLLFGEILDWGNAEPVTLFYATRNLAVLGLCLAALASRNAGVVYAAVLTRLLIESVDLVFTLRLGLLSQPAVVVIIGWLLVFTLPQLWCLWRLRHGGAGWRLEFSESVTVQADVDTVWAKLSDHESMPGWVRLGLRRVALLPDGDAGRGAVGSLRRIWFAGWPAVTERFTLMDAPREYRYTVIDGMPHLRDHLGIVTVTPEGGGATVRWAITFVFHPLHPLSWVAPVFTAGFQRVVRSGLAELKGLLDAGRAA